ncbi:hypothetical protein GGI08_000031 [Coemansia sp. S2]|nr:hypothetical protein GGI08_000031 [Coemansia sp. S2]
MVSEFTGRSSYPKNSAISNVLNFAQLLKSMVPAATTIEVLTAIKLVLEDDVEEELIMAVNDSTIDVSSDEHKVVPDEELIGIFSQTLYTDVKRAVLDLGLAGLKNLPVIGLIPQLSLDVKGFNDLQEFDTGSDSLSLFKVFALLKAFPALVKLRSKICGLGSELEHIATDDLPDYHPRY